MPAAPPRNAKGPFRYTVRVEVNGTTMTHVCRAANETAAHERVSAAYPNHDVEISYVKYLGLATGVKIPPYKKPKTSSPTSQPSL